MIPQDLLAIRHAEFANSLGIDRGMLELMETRVIAVDVRTQLLSRMLGQDVVRIGVSRFGQRFALAITTSTPGRRVQTTRVFPPSFGNRADAMAMARALAVAKECDLDRSLRQA